MTVKSGLLSGLDGLRDVTSIKTWTDAGRFEPAHFLPSMSHVVAYGYSPTTMNLQIRSLGKITDHGSKEWQIISNARLNLDAAIRLHAGLELWIEDQTKKETAS